MANGNKYVSRRDVLKGVGGASIAGLAGCTGGNGGGGTTTDTDTVKAAWLYNTAIQANGWTYEHHRGLEAAAEEYDWLETNYTENVDPDDTESVSAQYAEDGYDIVYGTSFGFQDGMFNAAKDYPDTIFDHCSGFRSRDNMGRYFARLYQGFYLGGMASGMVTESNTLGYVGAFPIPEVVRWINAWTLGAATTNPDVSVKVRWLNTWYDPTKSKDATNALADAGADVIAHSMNSAATLETAKDRGIWGMGLYSPMREQGGDSFLTSPIWHWPEFYIPELQTVREGNWESDFDWWGFDKGLVDIADWGPEVPESVRSEVASEREAILNGDTTVWEGSQFEGESDTFLFSEMASYVPNVEGEVP